MHNKSYFVNVIKQFASASGEKQAISVYDGLQVRSISYPEFADDILKVAGYFKANNICNQHIALIASNCYESLVVLYGIITSGNVAALLNPALPDDELRRQCVQADVSMTWSDKSTCFELRSALDDARLLSYDEVKLLAPIQFDDIHPAEPDKTILLLSTSGTTGKSKIVEISIKNIANYFDSYPAVDTLIGLDRLLWVLPLYHIGGVGSAMLALSRGKTVCIGRGMRYIFMDLNTLHPTYTIFVPVMLESLEKIYKDTTAEERMKRFGGSLKRINVAGAASKPATCQYLMEQGLILETAYGMTETTGVGTWGEWTVDTIGSIGKVGKNVQCRIKDGEILLKSDAIMKGYYKDPEETAKVIVDGWLHTGDMGYCDENGYYYITGRKKNVIILSNGENVNPEEIEATFGACTAIEECMVYSDGKGICADVFANDPDSAATYIKHYNESMPMYRQVYKVNYSSEPLPKTSSGKIKRKENS